MDILVHVPNLQHSGIPEYVMKSSETVDLIMKTALFLNFYFFRSELCGSEALQKHASVAASRLRSRKKAESIFSTINEIEGIALPCL